MAYFYAVAWHGLHKTVPLYLPIVCTLFSIHIYIYIHIYTYVRVWSVSCTCPAPIAYSSLPSIPMKYPKGNCDRIQFGKEVYILRVFYLVESLCFEEIEIVITVSERERDFSVSTTFLASSSNPSFNREPRSSVAVSYFAINIWYTSIYIMYIYISIDLRAHSIA